MSSQISGSNNIIDNQLFEIDPVSRTYGIVGETVGNTLNTNYSFLQINNYASGYPLRYDTIVIHFPINYTFDQYIGFYLKSYAFDYKNVNTYDLCDFYFDITNYLTSNLIEYTNPPMLYQQVLWGKQITILIPALYAISNQRQNNIVIPNSVNYNLTGGIGLSQQSPIFLEFSFINISQTINNVKTYLLAPQILTNVPQIPDFQQLGVMIQPATDGDYFQIFGVFNNNIADFNMWMNNSVYLGNNYYVNYIITTYEQNIRINSLVITVTNNFNNPTPFRPIIKNSSTTAVIDVEMDIIDAVDGSTIVRRASYGMLQDEVSKYSLNLTKINLASATLPRIYNLKSAISSSSLSSISPVNNIETVQVPFAVLISNVNLIAQSDNVVVGNTLYYGDGKIQILIKPFDNIIKFTIAQSVITQNNTTGPNYFDLTSYGQIQLVFKNSQIEDDFQIYTNNGDVNLANGVVVFLIPESKISDIRTIYASGINIFYITATQQNITTVIYSGLFELYDSVTNINNLTIAATTQLSISSSSALISSSPINATPIITALNTSLVATTPAITITSATFLNKNPVSTNTNP